MAGYEGFRNKEQADNARAAALNPVTSLPSNGYSKMTQDALRAEIAYLESIQGGSTPGSNASWRIGEELGMAKLYLKEEVITGGGGFGGGNLKATPITPVSAITYTPPAPPVKTATPDIVLFDDESVSVEVMENLLFENIGGQELINIARSDTINGQPISYQPIKNISAIQQQYNPNNIVSLQQTSNRFFAGFAIKLEDKIPGEGNGSNGSNIYIDTNNGNLTIELIKLEADEQVEIQIVTNGTIYEDTVEGFTS